MAQSRYANLCIILVLCYRTNRSKTIDFRKINFKPCATNFIGDGLWLIGGFFLPIETRRRLNAKYNAVIVFRINYPGTPLRRRSLDLDAVARWIPLVLLSLLSVPVLLQFDDQLIVDHIRADLLIVFLAHILNGWLRRTWRRTRRMSYRGTGAHNFARHLKIILMQDRYNSTYFPNMFLVIGCRWSVTNFSLKSFIINFRLLSQLKMVLITVIVRRLHFHQ